MKILFIEVDTESDWAVASLGPAFLAATLRRHGHEAAFFRATLGTLDGRVVERVACEAPDLIGVSLTTRQWRDARRILGAIRRELAIPVVVGGLHPTFSPEEVLRHPGIDYACLGEGEGPLLDLVEAHGPVVTPGSEVVGEDRQLNRLAHRQLGDSKNGRRREEPAIIGWL